MEQRPEQPPEGRLIAAAADRLNISIREAARRAGISYGRWRQIVMGYQNVSPGSYAEVRAPARTLAKMARVVGVTAEEMETKGQRPDAAAILAEDAPTATLANAGDDAPAVPDSVTTAVVLAAISPIEAVIWEQVRAGVPFTDPAERALWARELTPESQRVREIAALRSVRLPRDTRRAGLAAAGVR